MLMAHQTLIEALPRRTNGPIEVRRPTFQDDADAVLQGVVLAGFKKLCQANRDPRLERAHRQVLTNIAEKISYLTGTAYPDRRTIAEEEGLSERTVQNSIYELKNWGYLTSKKRASPEQHAGRLTHYTLPIESYSQEEMIAGIEKWCAEMRREIPRPWCKKASPPAVQSGSNFPACGAKILPAHGVKNFPAYGVIPPPAVQNCSEFPRLRGDRSINRENSSAGSDVERALALYNKAAIEHGFSVCQKLTDERRKRLQKRLASIGGLEQFALALSAIPNDDFLMGKIMPRKGQAPFKLDLERLLSTESGLGDVLARLIDNALTKPNQPKGRDGIPDHALQFEKKYFNGGGGLS
jgi:hypothetical protein